MSRRGDDRVSWDLNLVRTEDPVALAAVREAERIFAQQRMQGATAYKVPTSGAPLRINHFDPEADQIVVIPRVVGG
jgi:hypothetical protein